MTLLRITIAGAAAAVLAASMNGFFGPQEHPEHPSAKKTAPVSKEAVGESIRRYVGQDTELKGGFFLVWDKTSEKVLMLTLDKVHDDKLATLKDDLHFACADFKSKDGKTYDLDFFLKGKAADSLTVSEIAVHKEDGKARYDWVEEGGVWKKKAK